MPRKKRTRKTKMEVLEAITRFIIDRGDKSFYKSDLREIGIDPKTAEDFLRIIQYIQRNVPTINITETDGYLIINRTYEKVLLKELQEAQREYETHKLEVGDDLTIPTPKGKSIEVRLRCSICNEIQEMPTHCGQQVILDINNRILQCHECHSMIPFPTHCNKSMIAEYVVDSEVIFILGSGANDPMI